MADGLLGNIISISGSYYGPTYSMTYTSAGSAQAMSQQLVNQYQYYIAGNQPPVWASPAFQIINAKLTAPEPKERKDCSSGSSPA